MSFRVGLTGGIGSGKSTVASLFAELGVPVIDTDALSHQLTGAGGAAIPAIRAEFGGNYIDAAGALDRAKMRQLVFSDNLAKQRLEKSCTRSYSLRQNLSPNPVLPPMSCWWFPCYLKHPTIRAGWTIP